jgi:hypothetical protein
MTTEYRDFYWLMILPPAWSLWKRGSQVVYKNSLGNVEELNGYSTGNVLKLIKAYNMEILNEDNT